MRTYQIILKRNDGTADEIINLIDGDSFIFEPPSGKLFGRNAAVKWKLKNALRANETLRNMLATERKQVNLQFIPDENLVEELSIRLNK